MQLNKKKIIPVRLSPNQIHNPSVAVVLNHLL